MGRTNHAAAQIWNSMCCQVSHSAQRDPSPPAAKDPFEGWTDSEWVREIWEDGWFPLAFLRSDYR